MSGQLGEAAGRGLVHPLRWIPEFWELGRRRLRPKGKVMLLSLLVGVVAGAGAIAFYYLCQVITHFALGIGAGYIASSPGGETPLFVETARPLVPWMLVLVPAVGGLLSGIIVYTFAPEAEGHGTDAAIRSYHQDGGKIRARVPVIKMICSALTLGTGGSGGREGPIAQIGAGFGSFMGGILRMRAADRRVLMAAGMGAGIGAIFRAPLAGALFAAEVLYKSPDFESDVIIPAGLASVTAYCTFGAAFGWNPLFTMPPEVSAALIFNNPWHLVSYTVLALVMVILAMAYTRSFYTLTHVLHRLPIRPHFRPMIGALFAGVVGVGLYYLMGRNSQTLSVMSFGYGILQDMMTIDPLKEGSLYLAGVLAVVALGKILTTGLTIGSGGSGGIFGPSMVIGGCAGGALGIVLHRLSPGLAPHPVTFAIIGMAGFFAAAAKTPFSTLVIVSEMTGSYNLLLPTLWVCALAFLLSDEQSIYEAQVASPSLSPAHQGDYIRAVLAGMVVGQFVKAGETLRTLRPGDAVASVIEKLADSPYQTLPVTDAQGRLMGMVSLEDVHAASQSTDMHALVLASDLMRTEVTPLRAEDHLDRAVELFVENDMEALPVIKGEDRQVIGMVKRSEVARTYLRQVQGVSGAL